MQSESPLVLHSLLKRTSAFGTEEISSLSVRTLLFMYKLTEPYTVRGRVVIIDGRTNQMHHSSEFRGIVDNPFRPLRGCLIPLDLVKTNHRFRLYAQWDWCPESDMLNPNFQAALHKTLDHDGMRYCVTDKAA